MPCQTTAALPRPRYGKDMPLTALRTAELLLLQTLRLWVAGVLAEQDGTPRPPDWQGGLEAAGLTGGGIRSFDGFWRLLAAAPLRRLEVRHPACPHLSRDEGWFLQALQRLQAGDETQAEAILGTWLPPAGLRLTLVPLQTLAESLTGAGLILPARSASVPAAALPQPIIHCPDRGMALLH